jgi:hypothetical protein
MAGGAHGGKTENPRIQGGAKHFRRRAVGESRCGDNPAMSDENQIEIPPSFIALFVEPGRSRPSATRETITRRYEFCEALATMLVERAQTLQWQLGITEADVLEKLHAGLIGEDAPVPPNEGEWIIRRLAELLEWDRPKWRSGS